VIRFRCPLCGKTLKASEEKAGKPVTCPRCGEPCMVPVGAGALEAGGDAGPGGPPRQEAPDEAPPGLFAGMSRRVRCAAALLALAAPLGLLLAALRPPLPGGGHVGDAGAHAAVVLGACALVLLLAVLYGQGTSCPSCRRWWARAKSGTEFVGRELVDRDGVPFGRSLYRTTYLCSECGHSWRVTDAEEYPAPAAGRDPQRPRG
jgi:DNA-directed RNA polymerase subunit RPC12/RpoP